MLIRCKLLKFPAYQWLNGDIFYILKSSRLSTNLLQRATHQSKVTFLLSWTCFQLSWQKESDSSKCNWSQLISLHFVLFKLNWYKKGVVNNDFGQFLSPLKGKFFFNQDSYLPIYWYLKEWWGFTFLLMSYNKLNGATWKYFLKNYVSVGAGGTVVRALHV